MLADVMREVILRLWSAKFSSGEKLRGTRSIFLVLKDQCNLSLISGNIADALWIALNKSNQALAETL